jgi:hypothetical protein
MNPSHSTLLSFSFSFYGPLTQDPKKPKDKMAVVEEQARTISKTRNTRRARKQRDEELLDDLILRHAARTLPEDTPSKHEQLQQPTLVSNRNPVRWYEE